jgi:site-specific recombinase XerD
MHTHKLEGIPRGISWESVEKLLAAPRRDTHSGRRGYAILQLLVTYGVRIGQATTLKLQVVAGLNIKGEVSDRSRLQRSCPRTP